MLSLIATWMLARRLHPGGFGLTAACTLLLSPLFLIMATELTTDPILAGWTAVGMAAWWLHHRAGHPAAIWILWLSLGLGLLTKGLVAIALPGFAIAGYAWMTGGVLGIARTLWAMHPVRGTLLAVAVNLPWSIAVWQRDPRFLEFFYVRFNLMALVSDTVNHTGPPWLYLGVLAAAFMPWLPSLTVGLAAMCRAVGLVTWRDRRRDGWGRRAAVVEPEAEDLRRYLVAWIVFPLLFLTAATSKLGTYILPILPAAAILLADAWWRWRSSPPRWLVWSGMMVGVLLMLAVLIWPVVVRSHADLLARIDAAWWPLLLAVSVLMIPGLLAAIHAWWCGRVLAGAFLTAGVLALAACLVVPRIHLIIPDLVARRLTAWLAPRVQPGDLVVVDREEVHNYHLVHDLGRRLTILGGAREVGMGHFAQVRPPPEPFPADTYAVSGENLPDHPFLIGRARLVERWRGAERVWLFAEDNLLPELRGLGLAVVEAGRSRGVRLYTNRPVDGPGP